MQPADVRAVVELTLANWDGDLTKSHSAGLVARLRKNVTPAQVAEWMGQKCVFVVEEGDEVVATGSLADFGAADTPEYFVSQFFVRPDRHREGLGALLLAHLLGAARNVGADRVSVHSSRNAIAFYQHAGFVLDPAQPEAANEMTTMTVRLDSRPG
jgi:GNAT superfamily N-acetyltransferase